MSWWDTSNFSSLATQAFKNAQKKIDKVLDIEETEAQKRAKALKQKTAKNVDKEESESKEETKTSEGGDFWSDWMSQGTKEHSSESKTTSSSSPIPSSWNLPWASSGSGETTTPSRGDGDGGMQSESPSSSPKSKSTRSTKLLSSNKESRELKKPSLELEPEVDEGSWVGDSSTCVSSGSTSIEERDAKGDENASVDLVAVDEDINKQIEIVQHPELTAAVKDDLQHSDDQWSSYLKLSSAETEDQTSALCVESSNTKQSLDIQEMSVNSASGWEISDSVIDLVEKSEIENVTTSTSDEGMTVCEELDFKTDKNILSEDVCVKNEHTIVESGIDIAQDCLIAEPIPVVSSSPVKEENMKDSLDVVNDDNMSLTNISSAEDLANVTESDLDSVSQENTIGSANKESDSKHFANDFSDKEEVLNSVQSSGQLESSDSPIAGMIQGYVNISLNSKESGSSSKLEGSEPKQSSSFSDLELAASATSSEFEVASVDPSSSTGSSETGRLDSSADTVVDRSLQEGNAGDRYSLFGDVKMEEEEEENREEGKGHPVAIADTVSPASSFVKCMLEEAMEESCKEDSSSSDNHSNGSKSESSKFDSEFDKSVYSGQESSDDIETTTSSDIEIISAPGSVAGGLHNHPGFDLPPLKISIQQRSSGGDRHGHHHHSHHHFDSQSSSSTQSKCGEHEELSPDQGEGGHTWREEELQHPDLEAVQEEGADNPYHPERLLKLANRVITQHMNGEKKLAEMAEVLQARETKLVSVSKDNHQLVEDVSILRSQLQQSEEARESETADLKALTDEFTIRIGESEKKLQAAIREKESLKQQLTFTQSELGKRSQNTDIELLLEEKTEQVQELMREGEKLSKQQLQSSNIIKKLRAKEKETDATLTSQKKKLEDQTAELERLRTVLDSKEDMESKQADAIIQLNAAVQKQEQDYAKVLSDLEDNQEKNRGLQTAVDNAYKEIAELHRNNASQDSKAQVVALSKETSLREEMKMTLEREQQRFRQERESFIMQADDLRLDMTKLDKEHNRREDLLREEIAHLQERLQQDEARSQDLSQSITSATRPLLRQIENLQATYGAQSNAWEKVEKSITDRLAEAQISLAMAQEKERTACENEMELKAKTTTLESANSRLKQEKAQLVAQRESDQFRLEELQDSRNSFIAQLETSKQVLNQELSQVKIEKVRLESHLALETNKLENEKKKATALEEQLHILERERPKSRGTPSPSPSMSVSRQDSLMGSFYERNSPGAGMNMSFSEDFADNGSDVRSSNKTSVYENLRHSGATIVVENLQSQLKMREGEISHLQTEIAQLERTRESMARELVNLSNQIEELSETKKNFEHLEEQHKELNNRYSAILLMYGEKEEQVQELQLDLQDVKEMYKSQIDSLLTK